MKGINVLINRIDQEIAAEVGRQKSDWAKVVVANRERDSRLQRYETDAKHIIELVKPRLDAFIERFKSVVKVCWFSLNWKFVRFELASKGDIP